VKIGAAALILAAAIIARGTVAAAAIGQDKTTRDRIYTKEQAARGAELYVKFCEKCHDPAKVPEGKKPGPQTIGPKFLDTWQDRTLGELFSNILNTMPNDGSAILTSDQTLDLVAHLLKANGFPEGDAALRNDAAMKATVIVKSGSAGVR